MLGKTQRSDRAPFAHGAGNATSQAENARNRTHDLRAITQVVAKSHAEKAESRTHDL